MANILSVHIVSLGDQRQPINFGYLKSWRSDVFEIVECSTMDNVPDANSAAWEYPDSQLNSLVPASVDFDLTLIVVAAPLEGNFYSRRLTQRSAVVSLYEMSAILAANNLKTEDFLIQRLYALSIYFRAGVGSSPTAVAASLAHHAVRGCLFDMNANKSDIIFSMNRPTLCGACQTKIGNVALPSEFLSNVCVELKRIHRPKFYVLAEWVRSHPILALFLTALASLFINLLSNSIFEKLKRVFLWIG
jgi:hypothetical protein